MNASRDPWRLALLLGLMAVLALVVAACGTTPEPTATPAQPTATLAPGATPGPDPTATPAPARDMAAYFRGQTVQIVVPFTPGGGYDVTARILAPFLSNHVPGNPRVIIRNVPGAGGLQGITFVLQQPPDGLAIGMLPVNRFYAREIIGVETPGFSIDAVRVLGTVTGTRTPQLQCVRTDVAQSWEEVMALGREITIGGTEPGGSESTAEFLRLAGGPIRVIYGYGGGAETFAALNRRELDATVRCASSFRIPSDWPEWIENRTLVPFSWDRREEDMEYIRQFGLNEQPRHIYDLPGLSISDEMRAAYEASHTYTDFVRSLFVPSGVPDDVFNVWLEATEAAANDPDVQERLSLQGLEAGYGSPDDLDEAVEMTRALSAEAIEYFKLFIGDP